MEQPRTKRSRHSVLCEVAMQLKDAYIAERRFWFPDHRETLPKRWEDGWEKAAAAVLKHSINNLRSFVHYQFAGRTNKGCCPSPSQVFGPAAFKRWISRDEDRPRLVRDLQLALQFQKTRLRTELQVAETYRPFTNWTSLEAEHYVLMDERNQLTRLFRYCLAVKTQRPEAAEHYREAALLQYVTAQELYDEAWGDLIPDQLKAEARSLCLTSRTG